MTTSTRAPHCPNSRLIRETKDIVRVRRFCERSMVGASKMERSFFKRSIALLDHIISLHIELDTAVDDLHQLAKWKPGRRLTQRARAGR